MYPGWGQKTDPYKFMTSHKSILHLQIFNFRPELCKYSPAVHALYALKDFLASHPFCVNSTLRTNRSISLLICWFLLSPSSLSFDYMLISLNDHAKLT